MTTQTLVGNDGSGASRQTLYRRSKRFLSGLLVEAVEPGEGQMGNVG